MQAAPPWQAKKSFKRIQNWQEWGMKIRSKKEIVGILMQSSVSAPLYYTYGDKKHVDI